MYVRIGWRNAAGLAGLSCLALAGVALVAGSSQAAKAKKLNGKGMNIAFIGYSYGNTTSDAAQRGAIAAAKKANAKVTPFDGKFNPGVQVAACRDAATSGRYKAIIFAPVAGPASGPCADAAKAAKIPLILWGSQIGTDLNSLNTKVSGVTSQVLTPLNKYGAAAAKAAVAACKGINPCNVVILSVGATIPSVQTAFDNTWKPLLAKNSNIKVVATPQAGFGFAGGQKALQDLLAKGTQFNVISGITTEGMKGALAALQAAGKKVGSGKSDIRMAVSGGSKFWVSKVQSGLAYSVTVTLPVTMGTHALKVAVMAGLGQKVKKGYDPSAVAHLPLVIDQKNKKKYKFFKGQNY